MSFERPPGPGFPDNPPSDAFAGPPVEYGVPVFAIPPPRPRFQHRYRVHALWLLATFLTTWGAGVLHYWAFLSGFDAMPFESWMLWGGFWYSGTLLAILGAHEMGHYAMCRVHRVDATLPYFLPAPLPLTGTVGAFIKIREAFPSRAALFDIGVGGPIAGFVVLVPALFVGLALSNVVALPASPPPGTLELGEPLLFQWAARLVCGAIPDGHSLNLHPMAFAAWFGLIATALNLLPFGQLDGGHIAYAAVGRRALPISLVTILVAVGLTAFSSSSWFIVTLMLLVMLFTIGARHPRVPDEHVPLDPVRLRIAVAAAIIFVICFTPAPIEPFQLISNP